MAGLGGKFGERLLSCSFYDHTEQDIVGVAINPLVSGDVVQSLLTHYELQNLIRGVEVRHVSTGEIDQAKEVPKTASLVKHLPKSDDVAVIGKLRNVFPDIIVQRKESLLCRQHHGSGGKLLRYRTHVKNRLRRKRNSKFEICRTVSLAVNKVTLAYDSK